LGLRWLAESIEELVCDGNVNSAVFSFFINHNRQQQAGSLRTQGRKSAEGDCGSDRFGLFFSRRFT
jgi:hypothetical protein